MTVLADNALTTLTAALDELGLTSDGGAQDDRVRRYINVGSAILEQACGRRFYRKSDHEETVGVADSDRLLVTDHLPVVSVSSVAFLDSDGTTETIGSSEYTVEDAEVAFLRRVDGSPWIDTRTITRRLTVQVRGEPRARFVVTYTGGYITPQQDTDGVGTRDLPYDIEDAVLQYVSMRNAQRGADTSVKRISMDDGSLTYVDGHRVPSSFSEVVSRYRRGPL